MKILIETSALVSAAICWEYKERGRTFSLRHRFFHRCSAPVEYCKEKGLADRIIVTKTVEDEARNALDRAVESTIRENAKPSLIDKYGLMVLQHIVLNEALDRMDYFVEECSTRLPIRRAERDSVKKNEIEPFLQEISKKTLRYIQPRIPKFIKERSFRNELVKRMVQSLPSQGVIYKGMPSDRDLTIMAEATLLYRRFQGNEKIYVASVDNHFKPNPVQIGSYHDPSMWYTGELDSTVRDKLAEKFGFIGEDPLKILEFIKKEITEKVPVGEIKAKKELQKIQVPKQIVRTAQKLEGTLEAVLLDKKMEQIERLPVGELAEKLQGIEDVDTVIFDGVITQRLVDIADEKRIKYLVGARVSEAIKQPLHVNLLTFTEIEG